jgi:spermidine synthase
MREWEYIDAEDVPDDDGVLYLMSRGTEFAIHVDGRELMTNRQHGSEDALADLACDRLDDLDHARVLVGGMGMGFTLAAALRRLGPHGHATVAELMPAVVRWNRDYVGAAARHPLRDPRVEVYIGDVGDLVERPPQPWSTILLDVDNGPRALTRPTNGWLYTKSGLAAAHAALIPRGILGIWSADNDPTLTRRLEKGGFEVEVVFYHEDERPTPEDDGKHVLWMARKV